MGYLIDNEINNLINSQKSLPSFCKTYFNTNHSPSIATKKNLSVL